MLSLLRTRRFAPLFLTQLLGALNDNLFKSALVVVVTLGVAGRHEGLGVEALVHAASAALIAPFFLFSALAGELADRHDKARLIRRLKLVEVAVMGLAVLGFWLSSLPLLFAALTAMGTQSAFFGPLKYGILPQHLEPEELVDGNGLVEMGTFVAILAGTLLGGLVIALPATGVPVLSALLLAVAAAGYLGARSIPEAPPVERGSVDWNLPRGILENLRLASGNRPAWLAILGASWFWFLGALLLAQLPLYATELLGGDETTITLLLAVFTVGIGVGSVLAAKLSGGRIELGLVTPASVAMVALLCELAFALETSAGQGLGARVALDLFALGAAGGLFIVPLYALMQERAQPAERSRIVAANNIVNAAFMVGSALFALGLRAAGLSLSQVLFGAAALGVVATAITAVQTRDYIVRVTTWCVMRVVYRIRHRGLEAVPDHGAAIVVANHVTYVDAMLLGGMCRRPIRFIVDHRRYDAPATKWFFQLCRAIPIAPKKEDPKRLAEGLAEIERALAEGEVLGLFPEGRLSRDGELGLFRPGIERILAKNPVPVIPVALKGLWGSFFSYAGGKPLGKMPRRFWSRVEVIAGRTIAPEAARVDVLRAEVDGLLEAE